MGFINIKDYMNIEILSTSCNTLSIHNTTMGTIIWTESIYDADTNSYTISRTYSMGGGTTIDIGISNDGIYKYTDGSGDAYIYFAMCNAATCYVELIKKTICTCCEDDSCKPSTYSAFNEFKVLWDTYINMISVNNEDIEFTNVSSVISKGVVVGLFDLKTISDVYDRMLEICNGCSDIVTRCKTC